MIATDFAANESFDDAWLSFKLLFQPWRWINGDAVNECRKNLKSLILNRKSEITFFLTGRSALFHLLKSLRLKTGTEVIVQAFTCEAVVLPIMAHSLKPVYIDIEKETLSADFDDLKKKYTAKVKVLILQHTFGQTPKNRQKILEFAQKNGLFLIEDLAHGFSPDLKIDDLTNRAILLSSGRSKAFSSVFGGILLTDKKLTVDLSCPSYCFIFKTLLYKPLSVLIKATYDFYIGKIIHFFVKKLNLLIPEITKNEKDGKYDPLLDKAYPNALGILLLHQLKKFDQIQRQRALISSFYAKATNPPLLRFPIFVENRDNILKNAAKNNVFLGVWYNQVVAPHGLDLNRVGYTQGSCPVAEDICKKVINLPTNITIKEASRVVELVTKH